MVVLLVLVYINKVFEYKDVYLRLEYWYVRNFIGMYCILSVGVVV